MNNPWNKDEPYNYAGSWLATEIVQKHINQKISGSWDVSWLPYVLGRYATFDRAACRCLVLGCSEGWVCEFLATHGFTGEIVASDIADKALARARNRLQAFGNIRFVQADLNSAEFDGYFDLVIAEGVLHHIRELEACLRRLHGALAKDGILVAVEFEGPFRFQLPDEQLAWINAALNVLPKGIRGGFNGDSGSNLPADVSDMGRVYYPRASEKSVEAFDPSEAISGYRMRHAIEDNFRIVERKPFGGTLLGYMVGHFPFSEADRNQVVSAWLRVLIQIEDTLTGTGVLPDEFVFYVLARK